MITRIGPISSAAIEESNNSRTFAVACVVRVSDNDAQA